MFIIAKCVVLPPSTEASVSAPPSNVRLIYMAPHQIAVQNRIVLLASGILNALPYVPTKVHVANASEPTTLPKGILIGIRTDLP